MVGLRSITLLSLVGVVLAAPLAHSSDKGDATPWEVVFVGPGKIAVPKGWRSLDKIKPGIPLYRQGDGIGVPVLDETKSPLQVGLTVEKFPGPKESVKEIISGLVERAKKAPRLELVGKESVESIKLSDGTEAMLLKAEFIKERSRRSLVMKLVVKDADSNAWIVSGYLVGGKESKWPTVGSNLAKWLETHLTSFCLDEKKFDVEKISAAYKDRGKEYRPAPSWTGEIVRKYAMPDKQFIDRQARVRIDLPNGWVLLKRNNPLIPAADAEDAKMIALHQGSGCLATLLVMDDITSQNYFDDFLANLKSEGRKNETNATELERHSVTFGGIEGRRAKLTVTDKSGSRSVAYITGGRNNKRFYVLTGEVQSDYAEAGLRAFIDLEKSFSIIISAAGSK